VQGEAQGANAEAAANYPEDLAKIINEGSYTKQLITLNNRFSMYTNSLILKEDATYEFHS